VLAFVLDVMNLVDLDDKSEHSRYFTLIYMLVVVILTNMW
jgi:hypothetical protein